MDIWSHEGATGWITKWNLQQTQPNGESNNMTIRRADAFWSSVNLKEGRDSISALLLARFTIHCQGQVVYLSKLAYMLLHQHSNAALILKRPHYFHFPHLKYCCLQTGALLMCSSISSPFKRIKEQCLKLNSGHRSVRGSHEADLISERSSGYAIYYTRGLWWLTATLRCEEGFGEVRRLITCVSPLSTVSSKLWRIMTPESRAAREHG